MDPLAHLPLDHPPLAHLEAVSIRDLIRRPAELMERIERGERLVISRYNHPVATLQPIDGWVGYPRWAADGHPRGSFG